MLTCPFGYSLPTLLMFIFLSSRPAEHANAIALCIKLRLPSPCSKTLALVPKRWRVRALLT